MKMQILKLWRALLLRLNINDPVTPSDASAQQVEVIAVCVWIGDGNLNIAHKFLELQPIYDVRINEVWQFWFIPDKLKSYRIDELAKTSNPMEAVTGFGKVILRLNQKGLASEMPIGWIISELTSKLFNARGVRIGESGR